MPGCNRIARGKHAPRKVTMRMTLTSAAILSALAFPPLIEAAPTAPVRQGPKAIDPAENGIGRWIPDVEFISVKGKRGRLSDFKSGKALVVAFTGASCPVSKRFAPTLAALEKAYAKLGVSFLFVEVLGLQIVMTCWFILKRLFGGIPVVVMHCFISPLLVGK